MDICIWIYDQWHDMWETSCDNAFQFMEGDWVENKFEFCPYCGKNLQGKKVKIDTTN